MSAPTRDLRAKVVELARDDLARAEDLASWEEGLSDAKRERVAGLLLAREAARRTGGPVLTGQAAEWIRQHYPNASDEWGSLL